MKITPRSGQASTSKLRPERGVIFRAFKEAHFGASLKTFKNLAFARFLKIPRKPLTRASFNSLELVSEIFYTIFKKFGVRIF